MARHLYRVPVGLELRLPLAGLALLLAAMIALSIAVGTDSGLLHGVITGIVTLGAVAGMTWMLLSGRGLSINVDGEVVRWRSATRTVEADAGDYLGTSVGRGRFGLGGRVAVRFRSRAPLWIGRHRGIESLVGALEHARDDAQARRAATAETASAARPTMLTSHRGTAALDADAHPDRARQPEHIWAPWLLRWFWLIFSGVSTTLVALTLIFDLRDRSGAAMPDWLALLFVAWVWAVCIPIGFLVFTDLRVDGTQLHLSTPLRSVSRARSGIVRVRILPMFDMPLLTWSDGRRALLMLSQDRLHENTRSALALIRRDNPDVIVTQGLFGRPVSG